VNINHDNYESWFLLYADNELTSDEQLQVDHFLLQYPALQEEFDQLMQLRLDGSDTIQFDEKDVLKPGVIAELERTYRIEPDYSIQFPNKQSLYKRTPVRRMPLYRVAAAAAILAGVFIVTRPYWTGPTSFQPVLTQIEIPSPQVFSSAANNDIYDVQDVKVKQLLNSKLKTSTTVGTVSSPMQETIVATFEQPIVSEEIKIETTPSSSRTNFTEEVVQAAEQRLSQQAVVVPVAHYDEPNTEALIRSALEDKGRSPVRGFIRKVGRSLFGELEQEDDRRYIRVASFKFPVKQ